MKRKFLIVFLRPSEGLRGPLRPSAISCIFYFIPSPQIVRRPRPKSNWFKFWLYISIKWYQDFRNPLACLKENYYSWLWLGCKLAMVEKRRSEGLRGPQKVYFSNPLQNHCARAKSACARNFPQPEFKSLICEDTIEYNSDQNFGFSCWS